MQPLQPQYFSLPGFGYQSLSAIVPSGTTQKDLSDPLFWSHVRTRIQPGDEIRVITEDFSNRWLLIVTAVGVGNVVTSVVSATKIKTADLPQVEARYIIKQRGVLKWCVVDRETDENIIKEIATEAQACKQRDDYIRALKM